MDYEDDSDNNLFSDFNASDEDSYTESLVKPITNREIPDISTMHPTTASVSESVERIRKSLIEQEKLPGITLNVLGLDQPLTFVNQKQVIIGRLNPSTNEQPDVDLSGFSLNTTGISRKHVKIQEIDGIWYLEDLGSRNGTWLNGKLLMAYQRFQVRDGDQIRAGNITIIVLTHPTKSSEDSKSARSVVEMPDSIILSSHLLSGIQKGLPPTLITSLMPFADALIDIMQTFDRVKKRSEREISIHRIEFVDQTLILQFTCRHEVLQLLTQQAPESLSPTAGNDPTATSSEELSAMIALQFMEDYFPQISSDQSVYYQRLLAQSLERCVASDFHIVYD